MKIANETHMALISLIIVLLSGCAEPTLSERLSGVWVSVGVIGDEELNTDDFEMQLEINKSGNVSVIVIDKTSEEKKVERGSGKIEGGYIVFDVDKEGIGKITIERDLLKIVDIKNNIAIVFKRTKL